MASCTCLRASSACDANAACKSSGGPSGRCGSALAAGPALELALPCTGMALACALAREALRSARSSRKSAKGSDDALAACGAAARPECLWLVAHAEACANATANLRAVADAGPSLRLGDVTALAEALRAVTPALDAAAGWRWRRGLLLVLLTFVCL